MSDLGAIASLTRSDFLFIKSLQYILLAAMIGFLFQAVLTWRLYRLEGLEKYRAHVPLCLSAAGYCFFGLFSFLRLGPGIQVIQQDLLLVGGLLVSATYAVSLGRFLEDRTRRVTVFKWIFLSMVMVTLADVASFDVLGRSFLTTGEFGAADQLVVKAMGGKPLPSAFAIFFLGTAMVANIWMVIHFMKKALQVDKYLAAGMVMSIVAIVNDVVGYNSGFKYFFPLVFFANALEIYRITYLGQKEFISRNDIAVRNARLAAIGEVAGGIAHEIRNPLGVIQMSLEFIESPDINDEQKKASMASVQRAVTRIAKITESLLSLVRESSSEEATEATLNDILEDGITLVESKLAFNGIKFHRSIPDGISLKCRPTEISQVLVNLISNAADAIASLDEKWIAVGAREFDSWVELTVTDSGNGIDPAVAEKLMTPFYTTKERGKGTGLGLSLSRRFVEGHGGTIFIDPKCANTRFVVRLPKERRSAAAAK